MARLVSLQEDPAAIGKPAGLIALDGSEGSVFGSPAPVGRRTIWGGLVHAFAMANLPSGDRDKGFPSPMRTAGEPSVRRMKTP